MDWKQAAEYIAQLKPKAVIPTRYGSIVGMKMDRQDFRKMPEKLDSDIQVD